MSEDPMYDLKQDLQALRSSAQDHEHDPRTCPDCEHRTQNPQVSRQQNRSPRDRQLKTPRRDR
jgi:hypothetical protein